VKSIVNGTTTAHVGAHYEKNVNTGEVTKYYTFGGQRVAMRKGSTLNWLHSDPLGSASLATNASGGVVLNSEQRYTPFGSPRLNATGLQNKFTFTGQRSFMDEVGLMDYNARMYSPLIGRFISADTIVPRLTDPQSLNRYSYVRNAPLSRIDPTGHIDDCVGIACATEHIGKAIRVVRTPAYRPQGWSGFDTSSLDVTQELTKQMKSHACDSCAEVQYIRSGFKQSWDVGMERFVARVRAGGMFDFKPEFQAKNIREVNFGGRVRDADTVANIFFGFCSRPQRMTNKRGRKAEIDGEPPTKRAAFLIG
jgi:RHS repeat-associated protein